MENGKLDKREKDSLIKFLCKCNSKIGINLKYIETVWKEMWNSK